MIYVYVTVGLILLLALTLAILIRRFGPRSSRVIKSGVDYRIKGMKRTLGEFKISQKIYMMKDHILDDFYDLVKYSDYILRKHKIPYTAAYGSLLGAMRHKGIMPWDDDADFFIHVPNENYDEMILSIEDEVKKDGYELRKSHDAEYFHVCKAGAQNSFPYIDWYQYRKTYRDEQVYPIKRVPYEDFEICVPGKPIECINVHYNGSGKADPMHNIVCTYPLRRYYSLWIVQILKQHPRIHKALDRISKLFFDV